MFVLALLTLLLADHPPAVLPSSTSLVTWPTVLTQLGTAVVVYSLTRFVNRRDKKNDDSVVSEKAQEKANTTAISELKQTQQSDILKLEGTIGIIVSTIEHLAGTTEKIATVTERVAGHGKVIDVQVAELNKLRDQMHSGIGKLTGQVENIQQTFKHLRDG